MKRVIGITLVLLGWSALPLHGQQVNYDEAKVPAYTLPDPLKFENGSSVADAAAWPQRRAEIL